MGQRRGSCQTCASAGGKFETLLEVLKGPEGRVVAIASVVLVLGWVAHWLWQEGEHKFYFASALLSLFLIARSAMQSLLLEKKVNVDVLVGLAIIASLLVGEYHAGAVVGVMLLAGGLLEQWTVARVEKALFSLLETLPQTVLVRRNEGEVEVPIEEVKPGDIVIVRAGERVAVDGTIRLGCSSIDESPVTGESVPADKGPDDPVFAGTVNLTGPIEVICQRVGDQTTYGQIRRLVGEARARRAPIERLVDRFARWYVPFAVATAGIVWWWSGEMIRGITVLIVFCPCAFVLATPTAIVASIGKAAKRAILVKGGREMESAARVRIAAFDKTGTLTTGRPSVVCVVSLAQLSEREILRLAASVERLSDHPFAVAVCESARDQQDQWDQPEEFQLEPGKGVAGRLNGQTVRVGRLSWVAPLNGSEGETARRLAERLEEEGLSVLAVGLDRMVVGLICLRDTIRADVRAAIKVLRDQKVEPAILTGDNEKVARSLAQEVGVAAVYARLLPADKLQLVERWRQQGQVVAFVGDGINDAPALAGADVGVAMGRAGSDLASAVADIVLLQDDLMRVPETFRLARKTLNVIGQNIVFSSAVNAAAVFAGAMGWINPVLGAIIHEASALIVIFNAMRLLK